MHPQFQNKCLMGLAAALCLALWLLVGSVPATAADFGGASQKDLVEPLPAPNQWQFAFTPYGWLMGVDGDVTARGHTVSVNETFIDLVEDSDSLAALMGYFEARKGPFAIFTDIVWADLTFSGNFQGRSNPIANLDILVNGNVDLEYELTIVQSGVAYEVARWPGSSANTALDLMGSVRYWNQTADISANVSATGTLGAIGFQGSGNRATASTGTLDWFEPVIGARIRHQKVSGSELMLMGDIGGFGVSSDFSWQVVATYGFDTMFLGMPLHSVIGYRALGTDYSESGRFGKNGIDAVFHGPVIGAKFRW